MKGNSVLLNDILFYFYLFILRFLKRIYKKHVGKAQNVKHESRAASLEPGECWEPWLLIPLLSPPTGDFLDLLGQSSKITCISH